MKGYVYILASQRNGPLYIGVTRDLPGRLYDHQNELTPGFTSSTASRRSSGSKNMISSSTPSRAKRQ
jgi:predicted GIY-YIG superfamily endonuclease